MNKIVYLIGSVRSGSTLLDLLISEHGDVITVGELSQLFVCWNSKKDKCLCGMDYFSCNFWTQIQNETNLNLNVSKTSIEKNLLTSFILLSPPFLGRILLKLFSKNKFIQSNILIVNNNFKIYNAIFKIHKNKVIIDSSKYPSQFKFYFLLFPDMVQGIRVKRDGRAIINSINKRGVTLLRATFNWIQSTISSYVITRMIPNSKIINIHYEHLCSNPKETMNRVFKFLDLSLIPFHKKLTKNQKHSVGGSPTIKENSNLFDIKLDNSWKNRLSDSEIKLFNRYCGWINRLNGYSK